MNEYIPGSPVEVERFAATLVVAMTEPTSTYTAIRQAMLKKQLVIAIYNGKRRILQPHILGIKNGREQALFLQTGGDSSSGLGPPEQNWRCLPLDRLQIVSLEQGEWQIATQHSLPQTCIDEVDLEVRMQSKSAAGNSAI